VGQARLIALLLALAPTLASAPAAAQAIAGTAPLVAADPAGIAAYLKQIGYRVELTTDQTGDPRILTGFAGIPASLWFNDCNEGTACESVRLQVGLLTDRKLSLAQVNQFNNLWRFGTLSLDEDADPLLNEDLWLNGPGMPAALFGQNIRQFEALVKELRDLVNAHEAGAAVDGAERKPPAQ
jgi:hypothetical protein